MSARIASHKDHVEPDDIWVNDPQFAVPNNLDYEVAWRVYAAAQENASTDDRTQARFWLADTLSTRLVMGS